MIAVNVLDQNTKHEMICDQMLYRVEIWGLEKEWKITFTADDVVVPDVPGMFTSFQIKGVPLFVDPRLFDDPAHYARIMGYDKPINFKLSDFSGQKTKPTEKTDSA
ncbi:hypothetical protein Cfor_12877 [Coptotermes formosanus]|uniref:Uncharacterized protein n=1 Tax=Coptotermes formosanus TaxID=36987 RepID=A0A6L2PFT3_COPFO|nr:hypothetical protein Cfor_12877 [Coptotermes formosanus]